MSDQSLGLARSRRSSSASTASRINLDRPYDPATASIRASSSGDSCTLTGFIPSEGLPMGLGLSGDVAGINDKTAPFSVDGVNSAVYINHTVYGDNPMPARRNFKVAEASLRQAAREAYRLSEDYNYDITPTDAYGLLIDIRRALGALGYEDPTAGKIAGRAS